MKKFLVLAFALIYFCAVSANTEEFGTWIEFEVSKKLFKKFELSLVPEVRLQDDWTVDEYMIDGQVAYEPFKFLKMAVAYRYNVNVKKKENETLHRFAFDLTGKHDFGRFESSLRTRLTNYIDDETEKSNYLRAKLKFAYNFKNNKFKPYTSYELFRNITENEFRGARFDIGFTRKIRKHHRVGLYYRLQDYYSDRKSIHIMGLNYRFKY